MDKLSNLKGKVDKLDISKLETTTVHLSKLSDVDKNNIVKQTEYDELLKLLKLNDTSDLVKNGEYMLLKNLTR